MSEPVRIVTVTEAELEAIVKRAVSEVLDHAVHGSPTLLTLEQAGERYSVPKTWLAEAAKRGDLPHVRLGHYIRLKDQDLAEFVEKHRVERKRL